MKAVIVAGGKGTRIRPITGESLPKALVPMAGKPIVIRQIELLKRYHVTEIVFLTGYLGKVLETRLRANPATRSLKLHFCFEKKPLGTAGGLWDARQWLQDDDFFVIYGDIAVEMDLERLSNFHRLMNAIATIVAHPNDHPQTSDLLQMDERGWLHGVLPLNKPRGPYARNLVPAAAYCCSPGILKFIPQGKKTDFMRDIFPEALHRGARIAVYNTTEYLRDMGTPMRFRTAENDLKSGYAFRLNACRNRPAVFFDRDGVLNADIIGKGVIRASQLRLLPSAAQAVRCLNQAGWLAIVTTNQPQVAKGFATRKELDLIHAKLDTELGHEGAWLDRIYYCPHHTDSGFPGENKDLKIDCDCRKPKIGMYLRAARELPVDLSKAVVIGDSWRDFAAARALGLRSYGVRTGINDAGNEKAEPDGWFDDALEAVAWLLQEKAGRKEKISHAPT